MAYLTGIACTPFGRHEGSTALGLITVAARDALRDAHLATTQIDGLLTGYATTYPHLMLANVVADQLGDRKSVG